VTPLQPSSLTYALSPSWLPWKTSTATQGFVDDVAVGVTSQHSLHSILSIINQFEQAFGACLKSKKALTQKTACFIVDDVYLVPSASTSNSMSAHTLSKKTLEVLHTNLAPKDSKSFGHTPKGGGALWALQENQQTAHAFNISLTHEPHNLHHHHSSQFAPTPILSQGPAPLPSSLLLTSSLFEYQWIPWFSILGGVLQDPVATLFFNLCIDFSWPPPLATTFKKAILEVLEKKPLPLKKKQV